MSNQLRNSPSGPAVTLNGAVPVLASPASVSFADDIPGTAKTIVSAIVATVNLPADAPSRAVLYVKNLSGGNLTLQAAAGEYIETNGPAGAYILATGKGVTLVYDDSGAITAYKHWLIVGEI